LWRRSYSTEDLLAYDRGDRSGAYLSGMEVDSHVGEVLFIVTRLANASFFVPTRPSSHLTRAIQPWRWEFESKYYAPVQPFAGFGGKVDTNGILIVHGMPRRGEGRDGSDAAWVSASQYHLLVPYYGPALVLAILPLFWAIRRIKRAKPGYCVVCGYDLRATPERCPECGTAMAKAEAQA